jgi:hypothetical protein
MIGFCLKCESELVGKRRGAIFCETKCRVAYNQQLKRDSLSKEKAARKDEVHLAEMLLAGVDKLVLYMRLMDAGVNQSHIERVKGTLLEWANTVNTDSILERMTKKQKRKTCLNAANGTQESGV